MLVRSAVRAQPWEVFGFSRPGQGERGHGKQLLIARLNHSGFKRNPLCCSAARVARMTASPRLTPQSAARRVLHACQLIEGDPPLRFHRSIIIKVPTQIMLVIIEDPPWLMNGSGMPTTGAMPVTIIRLIAT